ncbi:hypothetical protein Fmac_010453 [Flemingia macrophylla]|uniref:Uncharacterized protein n=1 Tax=Flemingia macrophylla TaxID=520843 RepID=A0ABD1MJN8_9FABA
MKVEVEIVSREDIRPSSPTPSHLKTYKLSPLDHLVPSPYAPIILFYTSPYSDPIYYLSHVPNKLELLKQSLSETLTQFYQAAKSNKTFPLSAMMKVLILCKPKIVDGAALSTFLKGWTERAKGCNQNQLTQPNFIASSLFPSSNNQCYSHTQGSNNVTENSTRLEIVCGMLWKSLVAVSKARFGAQRPSLVTHLVNLRRRMNKALCAEHAMGNLLWLGAAENESGPEMGLEELVGKLRRAISKVDGEFVADLRGDKGRSIMQQSLEAIGEMGSKSEVDYFGFSSWCNFGFYEADFGWGKPTWVSGVGAVGSIFMNLIIPVDTRLGDGIEVWVTLEEQNMTGLEANSELLTYAILDPSPLTMSSAASA